MSVLALYSHQYYDAPETDEEEEPDGWQPELLTVSHGGGWWTAADVEMD